MILVTGATGHIGRRVADLMAEREADLRLAARSPDRVPPLASAEVVQADYGRPDTLRTAMEGCHTAFIASVYGAVGERARLHMNAIDAAREVGVQAIVYLSFQGASPDSAFPYSVDHWQTEEHLRASGLRYTLLRDSFYQDLLIGMAGNDGEIRGHAGDGKVAWVSREDVAQTVATILAEGRHENQTLDVTGPEAVGLAAACARLSAISDRTFRYVEESSGKARERFVAMGAKPYQIDAWIGSYLAIAKGEVAEVSDTVERTTGRRPYTLEEYFGRYPERLRND